MEMIDTLRRRWLRPETARSKAGTWELKNWAHISQILMAVVALVGVAFGIYQWREQLSLNRTRAASELISRVTDRQFMDAYVRLAQLRYHAEMKTLTYEVSKNYYPECNEKSWLRFVLSDLNLVVSTYYLVAVFENHDLADKNLTRDAISPDFRAFCEIMEIFSVYFPELKKNEKLQYLRKIWGKGTSGVLMH